MDRLNRSFEAVLENIKGINLQKDNGNVVTSILTRPEVLNWPIWPTLSIVVGVTLLLGLAIGLGIVYVLDLLDDHFRSPEELQMHVGGRCWQWSRRMASSAESGLGAVFLHSNSDAAEAEPFRTLYTASALTEGGIRRLVFSSSEPGDGKTTVSANLGLLYSHTGKRTLLIDADMPPPWFDSPVKPARPRGLSTVLRDSSALGDALQANLHANIVPNLDVLAAGPRPHNPAELLTSDRFAELISWAEENYDQIIIDSPPAVVADAAIIGRLTDGVLLVVRPEKNRRRTVLRAAEGLTSLGTRVLGVVVNRLVDENREDYSGYGYGYGYAYSYHYGGDQDGESASSANAESDVQDSSESIRPIGEPRVPRGCAWHPHSPPRRMIHSETAHK